MIEFTLQKNRVGLCCFLSGRESERELLQHTKQQQCVWKFKSNAFNFVSREENTLQNTEKHLTPGQKCSYFHRIFNSIYFSTTQMVENMLIGFWVSLYIRNFQVSTLNLKKNQDIGTLKVWWVNEVLSNSIITFEVREWIYLYFLKYRQQ
jgi:hypothetical protein